MVWLGLLGFALALLLAIVHLNLEVPGYAEAKAIFGLAAKYLPVFPEEEHKPAPAMGPANVAAEADLVSAD